MGGLRNFLQRQLLNILKLTWHINSMVLLIYQKLIITFDATVQL